MHGKERKGNKEMLFLLKSTKVVHLVLSNPRVSVDATFLHVLHAVLHMGFRFAGLLSGKILCVCMLIHMWYIAMVWGRKAMNQEIFLSPGLILWSIFYFLHQYWFVGRTDAFGTVVLEKTPESPLDCKEIQPVHPKGNQPWKVVGRTDADAPVCCYRQLTHWKNPVRAGGEEGVRGWDGQMAHHWCNDHELGQTSGDGEGQRPGVLHSMGSQRVGQDWATEQQLTLYHSKAPGHHQKCINSYQ